MGVGKFTVLMLLVFLFSLSCCNGHLKTPSIPISPPPTVPKNGEKTGPDNTILAVIPVFLLLGLIGVVICHVLKKKGYRCTTEAQANDEVFEEVKDPELGGGKTIGTKQGGS